jgi:hypothetical protein
MMATNGALIAALLLAASTTQTAIRSGARGVAANLYRAAAHEPADLAGPRYT